LGIIHPNSLLLIDLVGILIDGKIRVSVPLGLMFAIHAYLVLSTAPLEKTFLIHLLFHEDAGVYVVRAVVQKLDRFLSSFHFILTKF